MITFLILYLVHASSADIFQEHPTPVQFTSCHPIDFDSYSRAQASKSNLIALNPVRTQPNFGGKYLLLKNELMMETLWLIVDCSNGKFFHETLSGEATFKPESNLVLLKNKKETEMQVWVEHEWIKIGEVRPAVASVTKVARALPQATPTPSPASADPTQAYLPLFAEHPASVKTDGCKKIDFDSNSQAQSAKGNIRKLNPDLTHANFAGKYLLLKNELLFANRWFIADCETGKIFSDSLTGNTRFQPNSTLILVTTSGNFPQLKSWTEEQWQDLPDPVRNQNEKTKNTVYGDSAKILFQAIPNPSHDNTLRFTNFSCEDAPTPQCTIGNQNGSAPLLLPPASLQNVGRVLRTWGARVKTKTSSARDSFKIQSGICSTERSRLVCKIETGNE